MFSVAVDFFFSSLALHSSILTAFISAACSRSVLEPSMIPAKLIFSLENEIKFQICATAVKLEELPKLEFI